MSIAVMTAIWKHAPYQGNYLLTLLALADWSDDSGFSWPAVETLAKKSRQSERNCRYVLRELEKDQAIVSKVKNDKDGYQINISGIEGGKVCPTKEPSKRGGKRSPKVSLFAPNTSDTSDTLKPSPPLEEVMGLKNNTPLELTPSEVSNKTKKGTGKSADARSKPFVEIYVAFHKWLSGDDHGWGPSHGKQLKTFLQENPDVSEKDFRRWLYNYGASEEINPAEKAREVLPKLHKYKFCPLDKFGKPKQQQLKIIPPSLSAVERHRRQLQDDYTRKGT